MIIMVLVKGHEGQNLEREKTFTQQHYLHPREFYILIQKPLHKSGKSLSLRSKAWDRAPALTKFSIRRASKFI